MVYVRHCYIIKIFKKCVDWIVLYHFCFKNICIYTLPNRKAESPCLLLSDKIMT